MLYHDWEAATYDEKWSISFDRRCIEYARDRFEAITGTPGPLPYAKALELGAGTGFFSLNLKQAGVLDEVHVTDLSPGHGRGGQGQRRELGFTVEGRVADAERIPYDDNTFDIVVGHAVIHHIPDVEAAFREMLRVLKPGGRFVIAGEPTRSATATPAGSASLTWRRPRPSPSCRRCATAGPRTRKLSTSRPAPPRSRRSSTCTRSTRTSWPGWRCGPVPSACDAKTEELTAAFLGWPVRTFEAAVKPGALGWGWACSPTARGSGCRPSTGSSPQVVPARFFYNVGITGVKPG